MAAKSSSVGSVLNRKLAGIPAWGWAALVGVGGAVVVVAARRRAGSGTAQPLLTGYGPLANSERDDGAGGGDYSGSPGDEFADSLNRILLAVQGLQSPSPIPTWGAGSGRDPRIPKPTLNPSPRSDALVTGGSPSLASPRTEMPTIGVGTPRPSKPAAGIVVGGGNVSNPVGSTQPGPYYQPSASDFATELPGGLDYQLRAPIGQPGRYATVVQNPSLGTGPVLSGVNDPNYRPGERYAQLADGRLQVIL